MGIVTIGVLCAVLLVFAVGFGGFTRSMRERYIRQIRGLRRERLDLEMRVQDLRAEVTLRRTRVETMRRQIEELEEKREAERRERADLRPPTRSALEILKDMGRLNDEGIAKAQAYLEKTRSEQSLEEALVILGIVSPQDMKGAERDAAVQAAGRAS